MTQTQKTPEEEKFDQFYADSDFDEVEEEEWCGYGIDSECVEPSLRNMGNCFECWLYQEAFEEVEAR